MPDPTDIDPAGALVERVQATVSEHEMLPEGSVVLVMLSGGGDSVALLRLIAAGDAGHGLTTVALHVNHMLRGEESDGDQRFCEELCASLRIELVVERVDVETLARTRGLNIEDAGRAVRYEHAEQLLEKLCAREGVSTERGRIAVAHTRDDRVETTLMRLSQGAGASGLTSLRPVRGRVVRPLADCPRTLVRRYLETLGQAWREDATNVDTDRLRAKIRHDLVPVFREINPRFDESLTRSLAILADEDDLLEEMAEAFVADWIDVSEDGLAFDRAMLATLSTPMLRRTLRAAISRAFPDLTRLDFEHVDAVAGGVSIEGFAHDLPGGVRAHDEYGRMIISRERGEQPRFAPRELLVPGEIDLDDAGIVRAAEVSASDVAGTPSSVTVDADKIQGGLEVGPPIAGERMMPLGMEGTKKISDLLVDSKVPRRRRMLTPVVRDRTGVVWVAGVRMSETHKVDETTERFVGLTWSPQEAKEESG